MTHEEQRVWLIKELQKNSSQLSGYRIPDDEQEHKDLLRALMNIWMPEPLSDEFIAIQDEYLAEENRRAGITDIRDKVLQEGAAAGAEILKASDQISVGELME